jgi:RNA polymerase sigma-70 factor (ECF subfamily)
LSLAQDDYLASSEEALLGMFTAGDVSALEALLKRREKWLWNVAKKTIRDDSLAEEALQEALVLIWRNASSFRGESRLTSWMYQIVTRACIDVLRKEQLRVHASLEEFDQMDQIDSRSIFEEAIVDGLFIHGAMLELELEHRQVLQAIELEGLSVKEASALLKIPEGTVKSRAARAREALKQVIIKLIAEKGNQENVSNVSSLEVKRAQKK